MSKSNEKRKSGAAFWSPVGLALIVAAVFYHFDPCGCNSVVRHIPWLVRLIGEPIVCVGAFAISLLVRNLIMDNPEEAFGATIIFLPPGALAYWLTGSWIVMVLSSVTAFLIVAIIANKDKSSTPGANASAAR